MIMLTMRVIDDDECPEVLEERLSAFVDKRCQRAQPLITLAHQFIDGKGTKFMEVSLDSQPDGGCRRLRISVSALGRFRNNFIDDFELMKVFRRQFQDSRGVALV